jgi:hypothetical protein
MAGCQSSIVSPFQQCQNVSDLHANPIGSVHQFSIPSRLPVTTQLSPVASLLRYVYIPIISAFTGTTNTSDNVPRRLAQCILLGVRLSVSTFRKTGTHLRHGPGRKESYHSFAPIQTNSHVPNRTAQHHCGPQTTRSHRRLHRLVAQGPRYRLA